MICWRCWSSEKKSKHLLHRSSDRWPKKDSSDKNKLINKGVPALQSSSETEMPQIPACERWGRWGMHARKAAFAYRDQAPCVFSLSLVDFWQSQIGLLTADSQMSSSILIQEARRRHQPRLDFPRRKSPQSRNLLPPEKKRRRRECPRGASVNMSSSSQLPVGSVVTCCRCVSKNGPRFIWFPSRWISIAGYKLLLCINRKGHNSGGPWCASHLCDGGVFCDDEQTHGGAFVLCESGGAA